MQYMYELGTERGVTGRETTSRKYTQLKELSDSFILC